MVIRWRSRMAPSPALLYPFPSESRVEFFLLSHMPRGAGNLRDQQRGKLVEPWKLGSELITEPFDYAGVTSQHGGCCHYPRAVLR